MEAHLDSRQKVLIVDDEPFNVDYLEQELEGSDCDILTADNGREALEKISVELPDLILLDIMMPVMDGFAVLSQLKADFKLRDIPVIIISAMNDLQSVVKGIEQGAEDYLPKPFEPVLLHARVSSSLEKKRFRDQELDYLRQVDRLTAAAADVEDDRFDPASLDQPARRDDALGKLARVFQKMAREVQLREEKLKQQVMELKIALDETHQKKKVAEITDLQYFKDLQHEANELRNIITGTNETEI
jgi:two-component system, cell cycle response regulator